jgi:hypothetical protein
MSASPRRRRTLWYNETMMLDSWFAPARGAAFRPGTMPRAVG